MVRTQRYKYVVYDTGSRREQLFDLETDPDEINSVVAVPEFQAELNRHRKLLLEWAARTDDEFPLVAPA